MQLLDRHGRHPHAIVHDDAHQLGERIGAVARRADRGPERGHQMGKGIAQRPPVFEDAAEGVLLDQDADAGVLLERAAVEQPAIDLLPHRRARLVNLVPRGAGMLFEISHQPKFERMDAGHITAIGQIQPLGGIGEIEVPELGLAQCGLRQMRPRETPLPAASATAGCAGPAGRAPHQYSGLYSP